MLAMARDPCGDFDLKCLVLEAADSDPLLLGCPHQPDWGTYLSLLVSKLKRSEKGVHIYNLLAQQSGFDS